MGSNLHQRKQRDLELLRCARLRIHTFPITKVGMVLQLKGSWRVCTLGTMFLTSSRFSLLKMSAPEDHQVIQVVMAVALIPREEGMRGLQGAVLALACLLEHLKILVQVVQLEEEARKLDTERKTSMQLKRMILLRGCHHSMWGHSTSC
ncbi:uncharacterized protein LOC124699381 [Lolium rigidum]|uniref:uncharacterized protein LOC124699381 n=1 Tax=Lolium rigidum TaxID=89674 RepID=UPI001F5CECF3|nr:uncharacterized protein LOC124699381 [Lolium rigidum]